MEQHLKERLVGAVVLSAVAVILIPIILTGSPSMEAVNGFGQDTGTSAVNTELQPFSSKIVPLGSITQLGSPPPVRGSVSAPATIPVLPGPEISATRTAGTAVPPVKRPVESPVNKPANTKPATAPVTIGKTPQVNGWLVQLGSFSNARNALVLKERLQKKAYRAFTRTSRADGGEVTRVFVGPAANRQQAVQLAARLFTETRLKGMVVHLP